MEKKEKVAVLVGQLTVLGGVGFAAVNEVRFLRKLGVEAELVVLFRKKKFESIKNFEAEDIPVIFLSDRLPWFLRINFKFPFFSFFSFFHLSSVLWVPFLIDKYQVIVCHETYNCFSAIACAKKTKAKLISFIWDPVSYIIPRIYGPRIPKVFQKVIISLSEIIDRCLIKKSDLILLGSNLHFQLVNSIFPKAKVKILMAGTKILPKVLKTRKKEIVSLTKWEKGKNPEFLLEIASKLKNDFKFIIAGDWVEEDYKNQFKEKIKKLNLEKKIVLLGKITEEEKMVLFSQSRVLVHPIVEAFGMFALEAAACGCSFIIPKNSGVTELFEEGEHGFFPKEGDLKTYVEKISLLLNNESLAVKLGTQAYHQAQKYSWKEHVLKLNRLIKETLNE